ncbi:MAG: hypothetical protein WC716_16815 [Chitinophagaceae bacterium]|jgi:hypothetical protein
MAAIEVVSGFVTAAGATQTAVTVSQGTLTVRNFSLGRAFLLNMWRTGNGAAGLGGTLRVHSPRLHDDVQGIRMQSVAAFTQTMLPYGFPQELVAQDTLTMEMSGSAVAGDIENGNLLVYYENLDGANGKYIGLTELAKRIRNIFTTTHALVGAVTGAYGAVQALSAGVTGDLSKANTDYALLGATFSESAAGNGSTVRIVGPDTGNLAIGIPVMQGGCQLTTENWFPDMCRTFGADLIPVVNSANKNGTFLSVLNNENANTVSASLVWAQLA